MGEIIWDFSWNIGHNRIDEQHQKWIEIFNHLYEAVFSKNDQNLGDIQRTAIKEMLDYTSYHFGYEEKIMKESAYPDAYVHWRMHKNFENIVYKNYRNLVDGELILNSTLLSIMENWLVQHIQVEDKKLKYHLISLGAG